MSSAGPARLRALELYCGIGGFAAALPEVEVALAVDQKPAALAVYRANHPGPTRAANLEGLDLGRLVEALAVDGRGPPALWWMSPPCQPYTRRGRGRDLDDPRNRSFLRVVEAVARLRPRWLALENVPEFQGSRAHALLRDALGDMPVEERVLCPTELGVPMRRRRFYLVAGPGPLPLGREGAPPPPVTPSPAGPGSPGAAAGPPDGGPVGGPRPPPPTPPSPLGARLGPPPTAPRLLPPGVVEAYRHALHVLEPHEPGPTTCFTAAYGRSWVRSGSYLREPGGPRLFGAGEIARLLGFPPGFVLPDEAWDLVGASLSVTAVRAVLTGFGGVGGAASSRGGRPPAEPA